jgi:tetratricopeptide (TPR) repeat protein
MMKQSGTHALFMQGVALHQQGQLTQAQKIYERVLAQEPRHFDAWHLLGVIELQGRRYERALECIGKALNIKGREAGAHSNLGLALTNLGREEEALLSFERAIALQPNFAEAHYNRANTLVKLKRNEQALVSFDHAIQLRSQHAPSHYNRGVTCQALGRLEEALASFEQAIAVLPQYAQAHTGRGDVLQSLGRHEEALGSYARALTLVPDYAEALSNRGNVLFHLRRYDEALGDFDRALAVKPDYADAHYNAGNAWLKKGKPGEALQCFDRALALRSDHADTYCSKGEALRDLGQSELALDCYAKAIQIQPEHAHAHLNLANALTRTTRYAEALGHFMKAIEYQPKFAEAYSGLGNMYRDQELMEESILAHQKAVALDPSSALIHFHCARSYAHFNQPQSSLAYYERAIELDPLYMDAKWNRSLTLLSLGEFHKGWAAYGARHGVDVALDVFWSEHLPRYSCGAPSGRLLVVAEQGIGDEVLLSKSLGLFVQLYGQPACVTVDARLVAMFQRAFPVLRFFDRTKVSQLDPLAFDLQIALGDVAALVAMDPSTQPEIAHPHLRIDGQSPTHLAILGEPKRRPRIGLSWKSKNARFGVEKSMTLMRVMEAFGDLDVDWVNLQYGDVSDEIAQVFDTFGVRVHQIKGLNVTQDLDGWLKLISECDAVITGSNSTAHFAGAIGKSGVVVVPYGRSKLWYWHQQEGASTWYPSLELVPVQSNDGWTDALRVAKEKLLYQLARKGSSV